MICMLFLKKINLFYSIVIHSCINVCIKYSTESCFNSCSPCLDHKTNTYTLTFSSPSPSSLPSAPPAPPFSSSLSFSFPLLTHSLKTRLSQLPTCSATWDSPRPGTICGTPMSAAQITLPFKILFKNRPGTSCSK